MQDTQEAAGWKEQRQTKGSKKHKEQAGANPRTKISRKIQKPNQAQTQRSTGRNTRNTGLMWRNRADELTKRAREGDMDLNTQRIITE